MIEAENYNMDDIITPVKADILHKLLTSTGYCKEKTKFLIDGFKMVSSYNMKENLKIARGKHLILK